MTTPAAALLGHLEHFQCDPALLEKSKSCLHGYRRCISVSSDGPLKAISKKMHRGWRVAEADTRNSNILRDSILNGLSGGDSVHRVYEI